LSKYREDIRPEHQPRWDSGLESVVSGDGNGAIFIYKSLANDGCATALSQIGRIYEHGLAGVKKDFGEAIQWYKRSIETIDDLLSHLSLARIYFQDPSLDPTRELLHYHLNLLANNEVMGGYFGLGLAYTFGIGVDENEELADEWFAKAEASGHVGARLFRMKHRFLREPLRYVIPFVATSVKYHWLYFFTKNPHRLEMWDDPKGALG
jgi:TPR repeat protein